VSVVKQTFDSPTAPYAAAVFALLLAGGCMVDPYQDYELPQVGTVYTSSVVHVEDTYTYADGHTPDGPQGEIGILEVVPAAGTPAGGDTVFIHGWGFEKGLEAFFDQEESDDVFYVNSKKLRVVTPPHPLGFADVALRWPDGRAKILSAGFLYKTDLRVDTIQPELGPMDGGTPIAVTGAGFTDDSKLVIGHRLALQIEVVDDTTIFAVTPPGLQGGPVDIHVSNSTGVIVEKHAFTYTVPPRLDSVEPAAGPLEGGYAVELRGKWLSPVTTVLFGEQEAEIVSLPGNNALVVVPEGEPGFVDVVAVGSWGWDSLEDGYFYFDPEVPEPGIVSVVPDHGPDTGGNAATIVGCDVAAGEVESVFFGTNKAEVIGEFPELCSIVVSVPAGQGIVDVKVDGSEGQHLSSEAYAYLPALTVSAVAPNVGASKGGTSVEISGTHFAPGVQVLVGPMPASDVQFVDEQTLLATTPPGSPGLADVTVVSEDSTSTLKNAFLFTVKKPEAWVVTPVYGSRGGGTYVEILGAGFTGGAMLFFGGELATGVTVKSYGRITGYTPPNAVGTYDVTVTVDQGQAKLPDAYSYFDPTSWYGGTWGAQIDGAVNVTVFEAGEWKPLEGATVVLGADPDTKYKGETDLNGHVTLSGPGLTGPVDVHAAKKNHDAASFVHIDAENATLYLIPYFPPDTGTPDPPPALDLGSIAGRVVGLGKYVVVPPGDCKNKDTEPEGLCSACIFDDDCAGERVCLPMGKTGKYCTGQCKESDDDCPEGYMCAPVDSFGPHCVPSLGKKTARCEISTTSIYSFSYGKDPYVMVDDEFQFKLEETRLGELAVICLGGWVDYDTGEFHPVAMGVKRHINVKPGEEVLDQNIWLNIPLSRELRLRMYDPPLFEEYDGMYAVTAYIDFGSDGLFELPDRFEGLEPHDVMLTSMPAELSGDLFDASYILVAGAYTNSEDQTPYSIVMLTDITDIEETSVARLHEGKFLSVDGAPRDEVLTSAWTTKKGTYIVGERGKAFLYEGGKFYQLPSVVDEGLNDITGFKGGVLYAVGDSGVVVSYSGTKWELVGHATDMPLRSVWGSDADDIYAVGKYRIVTYYEKQWHEQKVTFDLHSVSGSGPDDVWAVGTGGTVLVSDGLSWSIVESPTASDLYAVKVWPNGDILVAGDGVAFLRVGDEWSDLGLDGQFPATSISGDSSGDFYLAGSAGVVAHWLDEVGFNYLATPDNLQANDIFFAEDGAPVAVGSPALLLKPFVPFPRFLSPLDNGKMAPLFLDWFYEGNSDPITLHTIGITERTGKSLWRLVIDGAVSRVHLPDFPPLAGVNPLPAGPEKRLRIYSAHAPEFSINAFDLTDLGTLNWTSWAYDMIGFK